MGTDRNDAPAGKPDHAAVTKAAGADALLAQLAVHVDTVHVYAVDGASAGPAYGAVTDSALATLPLSHTAALVACVFTTIWYAVCCWSGAAAQAGTIHVNVGASRTPSAAVREGGSARAGQLGERGAPDRRDAGRARRCGALTGIRMLQIRHKACRRGFLRGYRAPRASGRDREEREAHSARRQ